MARKARRGGGGQLGRSETVTIRLDPKLNYLAELAARAQRRTKSSLIEAALAGALNDVRVDPRPSANDSRTVAQIAEVLWHVDEPERLRRLAEFAPQLMTFEEQKIWALITKHTAFWLGFWRELDAQTEFFDFETKPEKLYLPAVEHHWQLIKKVAAGEAKEDELPQSAHFRPKQQYGNALLSLAGRSA